MVSLQRLKSRVSLCLHILSFLMYYHFVMINWLKHCHISPKILNKQNLDDTFFKSPNSKLYLLFTLLHTRTMSEYILTLTFNNDTEFPQSLSLTYLTSHHIVSTRRHTHCKQGLQASPCQTPSKSIGWCYMSCSVTATIIHI